MGRVGGLLGLELGGQARGVDGGQVAHHPQGVAVVGLELEAVDGVVGSLAVASQVEVLRCAEGAGAVVGRKAGYGLVEGLEGLLRAALAVERGAQAHEAVGVEGVGLGQIAVVGLGLAATACLHEQAGALVAVVGVVGVEGHCMVEGIESCGGVACGGIAAGHAGVQAGTKHAVGLWHELKGLAASLEGLAGLLVVLPDAGDVAPGVALAGLLGHDGGELLEGALVVLLVVGLDGLLQLG